MSMQTIIDDLQSSYDTYGIRDSDGEELIPLGDAICAVEDNLKPLTDNEINEIFVNNQWLTFLQLARILEKAHGIGVDNE